MEFIEKNIKGIFEIDLNPLEDHRGFFMRTYDDLLYKEHGLHGSWVQENHSYSKSKGMLRGLHFQFPPNAEAKLVRVVSGEIFMVAVDLRQASPTFSKWESVILSEENKKELFAPRGFALGMLTLSDHCTLLYKMDNYYVPGSQGGIKWDDSDLGIDWPIEGEPITSEKDRMAMSFKDFVKEFESLGAGL